jgi:anti-sigma factor ChrR (cupin superfamily)
MTGRTPNAVTHEGLDERAARFVDVTELPWEQTRYPGVETKTLLIDRQAGLLTALLRMAPGARLPDHEHVMIEQTFVIEGSLVDDEGTCTAGNYVWRPAGSRHEAWSPDGGLMLAMFQVPNKFFEDAGAVVDLLGQDWENAWGRSTNLKPG